MDNSFTCVTLKVRHMRIVNTSFLQLCTIKLMLLITQYYYNLLYRHFIVIPVYRFPCVSKYFCVLFRRRCLFFFSVATYLWKIFRHGCYVPLHIDGFSRLFIYFFKCCKEQKKKKKGKNKKKFWLERCCYCTFSRMK